MHVFHFTAPGLTALLGRHGFVEIQVSYHERWDANAFGDVEHARLFRAFDAAWGAPVLNRLGPYRRLIAAINSYRRFRALNRSLEDRTRAPESYSELQVSAVLECR